MAKSGRMYLVKTRLAKKQPPKDEKRLKNPRRDANCRANVSRRLGSPNVPADRGACEPETEVQGSE